MMPQVMLDSSASETDCALLDEGKALLASAQKIGKGAWPSLVRAMCVPYLFHQMESIFASGEEPVSALKKTLISLAHHLPEGPIIASDDLRNVFLKETLPADVAGAPQTASAAQIKEVTGDHYGRLFEAFAPASFWDEPVRLLRQRLERNDISLARIENKSVLDAGCGGGRYTVAWRLLGARPAVGLDASEINVTDARRRVSEAKIDEVKFEQGDVLRLPFNDHAFDVVFSNGVLHHTTDWRAGLCELVRVLVPGGLGWLYLIERPGGLFWELIEILRELMRDEDRAAARQTLQQLGLPANRIFYMLDHVMVPINLRLTPIEIEEALRAAGANAVRRLTRGTDFDRIERIYQNDPHARAKYGVGENRYVFSK